MPYRITLKIRLASADQRAFHRDRAITIVMLSTIADGPSSESIWFCRIGSAGSRFANGKATCRRLCGHRDPGKAVSMPRRSSLIAAPDACASFAPLIFATLMCSARSNHFLIIVSVYDALKQVFLSPWRRLQEISHAYRVHSRIASLSWWGRPPQKVPSPRASQPEVLDGPEAPRRCADDDKTAVQQSLWWVPTRLSRVPAVLSYPPD